MIEVAREFLARIPSNVTMYIQQAHLALEHIFCMLTERFDVGHDRSAAVDAAAALKE
jgi:hypothetical protein